MAFFQFIDPIDYMTGLVGVEESVVISTTDNTDYLQKIRLTATDLESGEYRVVWSYSWNMDSTSHSFEARVQINDTDDLALHRQEPKDAKGSLGSTGTSQIHRSTGVAVRTLSGTVNIDLDWRSTRSGTPASIWEARLELWRLE